MAKDPAFLFYTKDFITGIADLTMEERGQYISLLCLQHQKGHLSEKAIRLCVGNAAADVLAKFRQDPAGLWYNERLELEIQKRVAHGEKQKQRAVDGWKKRKNKDFDVSHGNATAMPLVNANGNINVFNNKECFNSVSDANKELTSDDEFITESQLTLTNRDWRDVGKVHIGALIFSFITTKSKYKEQTKSEVKQHFKNWLFSTKLETLQSTAKNIINNHERRQRSPTEVR